MEASHRRRISRLGGLARIKKHGNPGTEAGRRKGGMRSIKTHQKARTGFKMLKPIKFPRHSDELAELLGVFMGDGHVGIYQSSITTNSQTDAVHARYALQLIRQLFHIEARLRMRKGKNACEIVISSKEVSRFLNRNGMPIGSKVRDGVSIPPWIQVHPRYATSFVRGLFDTDGCVYLDSHKHGDRIYKNVGMAFTNRTPPLLAFFKNRLEALGMRPTQKTDFAVFLRRETDIRRYFDVIGTSNPKHRDRYVQFLQIRSGGVA